MRIAVIGAGYVGLVTGTCLAHIGHNVICTDTNATKIESLRSGILPIYEGSLKGILTDSLDQGRLRFTTDAAEAIRFGDSIFVCVGTPPLDNGDADLSAIERTAHSIAIHASTPKLIIEKSTVPVRTGERVERALKVYSRRGVKFRVASNPEFLREGTAVLDFMHPERIVVGVAESETEQELRAIYGPIITGNFVCPVHRNECPPSARPEFIATSINSAELIKHACNSFLAMKISYANLIADMCDLLGGDVEQVTAAMGFDRRIGPDFLRAGLGFGGFCFPKDIQAFIRLGEKAGVDVGLLKQTESVNQRRLDQFMNMVHDSLWIVRGKRIGLLGLSFKPETDDIRFSPALELAKRLLAAGATVCAYDPQALSRAIAEVPDIVPATDEYDAGTGTDALILATDWPQFSHLDWERIRDSMFRPLILDGRNQLDPRRMRELGFEYHCFGRPSLTSDVARHGATAA